MNRFMFIASDFDVLYKYCSEAEQLTYTNPGECCHKARMAIEFIKNDLVGKLIDLTNGIKELLERNVIDEKLYNILMEIRDYGNKGSHAAGAVIVNQADAQKTIDNLVMVCMWYALVQEKREYPLAYFDDADLGKLKYVSSNIVVRNDNLAKLDTNNLAMVQKEDSKVKVNTLEKESEASNSETEAGSNSVTNYKELLKLAQQGDVLAHLRLAQHFAKINNYTASYQWYVKAYKINSSEYPNLTRIARYMIGRYYESGKGVQKNPEKAFNIYKDAANKYQTREFITRVAVCYEKGIGTDKNPEEAFNWWMKLAQDGLNTAMYKIAFFYYKGYGCKPNNAKAIEWCKKSIDQGYSSAKIFMNKLEQEK